MTADPAPSELAGLRATWERIRPPSCDDMTFAQALTWPPMLMVLRMAQRAYDSARQSIEHPAARAWANVRPLPTQPTRDHPRRRPRIDITEPRPSRYADETTA